MEIGCKMTELEAFVLRTLVMGHPVQEYPESNKVLDKVFFISSASHYTDEIFDYIELKLQERYYN